MASPVADSYVGPSGGAVAGGRFRVSQFWRDLSPGWTEIPLSGGKPGAGITFYSGMALDSDGGKVYLFGGGHSDYSGNDVWEIDLEQRQSMLQHYPPSLGYQPTVQEVESVIDNVNYPGAIMSGGQPIRPITRHTYKSVNWIDSIGQFAAGGGSTYSGPTGQGDYLWQVYPNAPADFWTYAPTSKTWTYKGSTLLNAAYGPFSSIMAYDKVRDRVFCPGTDGNGRITMRAWNPVTNAWTLYAGYASGSEAATLSVCIDTLRSRVIVVIKDLSTSLAEVWAFVPETVTWEKLTASGAVPSGFYEQHQVVYSSAGDALLMVRNQEYGLSRYDMKTGVWSSEAIPSSVDAFTHVLGCFVYDHKRKAAILVYGHYYLGPRVFAYKEAA